MNLTLMMQNSMFYKQRLQLGYHKTSFPPDKAAEYLTRAAQIAPQTGFDWVFLDKPCGIP